MDNKELSEEFARISADNINYYLFIANIACNNYKLAIDDVEALHLPARLEISLKAQIEILSKAMSYLANKISEEVTNGCGTIKG